MNIIKLFKNILRPIVISICRIINPEVVVRVDGGICSQMHFYIIGRYFAEKGYRVSYETSWFNVYGKDLLGTFVRNFDLLTLNPKNEFRKVYKWKIALYAQFCMCGYDYFKVKENDISWKEEKPPVYLAHYYHDFKELYTDILPRYFQMNEIVRCLDEKNNELMHKIKTGISVAMHVRRGDLAIYNSAYGEPCSVNYFTNAVNYLSGRIGNCVFYIFSDEPEWCKKELVPVLPEGKSYYVVDINGSDKGYMDLVLMALCSHTITSKGSLGKYSACINNTTERIVILSDETTEKSWKDVFPNSVFIKN